MKLPSIKSFEVEVITVLVMKPSATLTCFTPDFGFSCYIYVVDASEGCVHILFMIMIPLSTLQSGYLVLLDA